MEVVVLDVIENCFVDLWKGSTFARPIEHLKEPGQYYTKPGFFMVTIFQRCQQLGVTDCIICSRVGQIVSSHFVEKNLYGREAVQSIEPHGLFKVWAYPDSCTEYIDHVIGSVTAAIMLKAIEDAKPKPESVVRKKRKRINGSL